MVQLEQIIKNIAEVSDNTRVQQTIRPPHSGRTSSICRWSTWLWQNNAIAYYWCITPGRAFAIRL